VIWNLKRATILTLCSIGSWSANAQLTVCNQYSTPLTLMITYKGETGAWINKGWFRFSPNECAQVQTTLRGPFFYYYAKADNGAEWTDSTASLGRCVGSKPFDTESCAGTDRTVNVRKVEFSGDQFTLNLAATSTPPVASPPKPAAPAAAERPAPDINQMHRELYKSDPVYQRKTDEISAYASGVSSDIKKKNQRTYQQIPDVKCLTPYETGRRQSGFSHYLVQNTCDRVLVVSIFCNAEPLERGLSLKPMEEYIMGNNVPSKCKYEVPY
jgi:uncharacterized membrane protein